MPSFYDQLKAAQFENRTSDPSSATGRFWIRTDTSPVVVKFYNGTTQKTFVTTDDTQTLTGKTLTGNIAVNLVSGSATVTLPTNTSTLATLALAETLTNKTLTTPILTAPTIDAASMTEQGSTPSSPSSGTRKLYVKTDGKAYLLDSAGTETQLGSGGAGGINYISNPDAETATTGWTAYADAAATTPVDGTGGSPTAAISRVTSSPLRGAAMFRLTKDAANRQGEGVGYAFTIATADKAKVLNVSFEYQPSSAFTAGNSSDIRVWIYDVTNSALIPVSPYTIQGGSGATQKFSGTFQSSPSSTSYRLIFHIATTNASAWTFDFDNVVVGPQIILYGAPITDWTAYTPTLNSNTNVVGTDSFYRRIGDSLQVWSRITYNGVGDASTFTVSIPSGLTIDSNKIALSVGKNKFGTGTWYDASADYNTLDVMYASDTAVKCILDQDTAFLQSSAIASGDEVNLIFQVPITGWSSSVQMSNDTDTRVVSLRASGDPASASSGNPVIFPTADYDTHGAYNTSTGRYTAPVSGIYQVYGYINSANAAVTVSIYVNAVSSCAAGTTDSNGECAFTGSVKVNAGDIIDLRPGGTLDATSTSILNISRLSGPAAVAATESVSAKYKISGGTANSAIAGSATEVMDYDTKVWDSHNAVTVGASWKFTAPVSGVYSVEAAVSGSSDSWSTTNTGWACILYLNGSSDTTLGTVRATNTTAWTPSTGGATKIRLLAGDYIDIRCTNSNSSTNNLDTGSPTNNWVSIVRVGNYS